MASNNTAAASTVVLELWVAGKLTCSSMAVLLPAKFAVAAAELDAWRQVRLWHISANYEGLLRGVPSALALR